MLKSQNLSPFDGIFIKVNNLNLLRAVVMLMKTKYVGEEFSVCW